MLESCGNSGRLSKEDSQYEQFLNYLDSLCYADEGMALLQIITEDPKTTEGKL